MSTHAQDEHRRRPIGPHRHAGGAILVAVMAVGSIAMWLVLPVAWLWLGSQMTSSSQPTIGPYLLVLAGTIVSMVAMGKLLGIVNRMHMRVTGRIDDKRTQATWMRSMRGERKVNHDRGVLEGVMMVSVSLALLAFAVWFFGFAGSSLPN